MVGHHDLLAPCDAFEVSAQVVSQLPHSHLHGYLFEDAILW